MPDQPTRLLLEQMHGGDSAALPALLERHLPFVRACVQRRMGDALRGHAETQDIVQDALVDVLRDGPRLKMTDEAAFRRLLAHVVENTIRDRHRFVHRGRRDAGRERPLPGDSVLDLDLPRDAVLRPSQHASADEEQQWVRLALEFLSPEDREVIWLREWDGLSFPEVGAHIGVAEEAARKRFERALPKLALRVAELRREGLQRLLDAEPLTPDAP